MMGKFDELCESMTKKLREARVDKKWTKFADILRNYIDSLTDDLYLPAGTLGVVNVLVGEDEIATYNMSGEDVDVAILYGDDDPWEYFSSSSKASAAKDVHKTLGKIAKKYKFTLVDMDDDDMIGFKAN